MGGWFYEFEKSWKVVAYFNVLSKDMSGGTEDHQETSTDKG
jgi:hypothetical protein